MALRGACLRALLVVLGLVLGCAEGTVLPPPPPICGDGKVDEGEACDDGAANSDTEPGACRTTCALPACGDGVHDPAEGCDDGNAQAGDGCDPTCTESYVCGDSVCDLVLGEECSVCAGDCCVCGDGTCDTDFGETCEVCPSECCPTCGDGTLDPGEGCDDGNNSSGDGCSKGCADEDGTADCGNGLLEAGEQCDDGNTASSDGCSAACALEFTCGDATCETNSGETCQLCQQDCCPDCGDGNLDPGEECDGAALNGQSCTGACYTGGQLACTPYCTYDWSTCTGSLPVCGDGVVGACGEECDGQDFQGATCGSLGFGPGALVCSGACTIDTSGCGPVLAYLYEGFDGGCPPAGWTLGGDWQCGTPSGGGPASAYSAPACLGTIINGYYNNNQSWTTAVVTSPPINLAAGVQPMLRMRSWVWTEGSVFDGYNLKVSTNNGASWTLLTSVTPAYNLTVGGESAWGGDQSALGWQEVTADLSAYVGQTIRLRIAFSTDGSVTYPGVYVDDFFVAEPNANIPLVISTSSLPSAAVNMPYQAQLAKAGGSGGAVAWSITGGVNHAWLSINPSTGLITGTPTINELGPVTVTVHVEEVAQPSYFADKTFNFSVNQVLYETSFESCPDGWALTGQWQCGTPTVVGPASAYDGTNCLGTIINGNYSNDVSWGSSTATSPAISLAGASSAALSFRMWSYTEGSIFDGANLKISVNGGAWTLVNNVVPAYNLTVGGESAWGGDMSAQGWQNVTADLSAYVGQSIQLQVSFRTDSSVTYPGVYIDYFRVE